MYVSIKGSRMDGRREAYRRSVRRTGGRADGDVERLRVCELIDLRRWMRSDFRVLSGSLRPRSCLLVEIQYLDGEREL